MLKFFFSKKSSPPINEQEMRPLNVDQLVPHEPRSRAGQFYKNSSIRSVPEIEDGCGNVLLQMDTSVPQQERAISPRLAENQTNLSVIQEEEDSLNVSNPKSNLSVEQEPPLEQAVAEAMDWLLDHCEYKLNPQASPSVTQEEEEEEEEVVATNVAENQSKSSVLPEEEVISFEANRGDVYYARSSGSMTSQQAGSSHRQILAHNLNDVAIKEQDMHTLLERENYSSDGKGILTTPGAKRNFHCWYEPGEKFVNVRFNDYTTSPSVERTLPTKQMINSLIDIEMGEQIPVIVLYSPVRFQPLYPFLVFLAAFLVFASYFGILMLPLLIHCRTRVLEFEMWTVFSMILVQMSVYLLACWRLWKVAYDKFLNGRAPPLLPESKSPTNISYIKCGGCGVTKMMCKNAHHSYWLNRCIGKHNIRPYNQGLGLFLLLQMTILLGAILSMLQLPALRTSFLAHWFFVFWALFTLFILWNRFWAKSLQTVLTVMLRKYWHVREWNYQADAAQDKATLNTGTVIELHDMKQVIDRRELKEDKILTRLDYRCAKRTEKDQMDMLQKERDYEKKTIGQIAALRKKAKQPTRSPLQMLANCSTELLEVHRKMKKEAPVVLNENTESNVSCNEEVSYFDSVLDDYRALRGKFPKKTRENEEQSQELSSSLAPLARLESICEDNEEECDNQDQDLEREEKIIDEQQEEGSPIEKDVDEVCPYSSLHSLANFGYNVLDDPEDESFSGTSLRLVEGKAVLNSSSIEHEEAGVLKEDEEKTSLDPSLLSSIEYEGEDEQLNRSIAESLGSFKKRLKERRAGKPF